LADIAHIDCVASPVIAFHTSYVEDVEQGGGRLEMW
jgi:hypothetical protein